MSIQVSPSIIQLYLDEIGQTPLLTADQERSLAERSLAGDEAAREQLVKANLRLVVKIAKSYSNYGVPLTDLISEGNIGLMRAAERYDPSKGGRMSTYAGWWIKQGIRRALAYQRKVVRLPAHVTEKTARIRRICAEMAKDLGREPTDEELCEVLGISRKKLALLKQTTLQETSLDAPLVGMDSSSLGDLLPDDDQPDPLAELLHRSLHYELEHLLSVLDKRELRVIEARFGLGDRTPMTLEEIGIEFQLTRERIRQVQQAALQKMRKALDKKDTIHSVYSA